MKKMILFFSVAVLALACNTEADKAKATSDSIANSASNVVLPADRSSDSLAIIPQAGGDSTGVRKDSAQK